MIDYCLAKGSHDSREAGMCAMEWVAYIAGEEHSAQPVCVSPVLKSFCIAFNDALPHDRRQRLRPYLTRCIGTAGDGLDDQRAWMATDWLVRECAPAWLDLAGLHDHAQNLRSLGAVLSSETARSAGTAIAAARKDAAAARVAARVVARDATRDAARAFHAARAAAWNAARDATWVAARGAAWAAARDATADATRAAAWDAARAATPYAGAYEAAQKVLAPTSDGLVDAAFGLLDRMLPTEHVEIPEPFKTELERLCAR